MNVSGRDLIELQQEMPLLWWVIVQACKDLVKFTGDYTGFYPRDEYKLSYEFIVDEKPLQLEGTDEVFTLKTVLVDTFGMDESNYPIFRQLLIDSIGKTKEEQRELVRKARPLLFWQPLEELLTQGEPMLWQH